MAREIPPLTLICSPEENNGLAGAARLGVVVDFIAEDKCEPAHLVSPNFSSSTLDSLFPPGKRAKTFPILRLPHWGKKW